MSKFIYKKKQTSPWTISQKFVLKTAWCDLHYYGSIFLSSIFVRFTSNFNINFKSNYFGAIFNNL